MASKVYTLSMLFYPAPDIVGQWIAHILDFDLVTQGNSLPHAVDMALEATSMLVQRDLAAGRDPFDRRAPEEDWKQLRDVIQDGEMLAGGTIDGSLAQLDDQQSHLALLVPTIIHFNRVSTKPTARKSRLQEPLIAAAYT